MILPFPWRASCYLLYFDNQLCDLENIVEIDISYAKTNLFYSHFITTLEDLNVQNNMVKKKYSVFSIAT